jgi:carboxyvinyl-carboxyphosphonate phosphorylmutase
MVGEMRSIRERRERFREVISRDQITSPASIYDAVSARLAEEAGFEVAIFAGSLAHHAILGAPDIAIVTLSEVAEQARRISRASSIPFWIDADHGYGNALSVARTIEDLEAAGASAVSIEDTALPQAFRGSGHDLISLDEFAGKLKAAVGARQDPSFVVIGRTAGFAREDVDSALRRIEACNEAGVDCIHVASGATPDKLRALAGATKLPIIAGGSIDDKALALECGVRIADWNHVAFGAVIKSLRDSYAFLRAGGTSEDLQRNAGAPVELTRTALAGEYYERATKEYLG